MSEACWNIFTHIIFFCPSDPILVPDSQTLLSVSDIHLIFNLIFNDRLILTSLSVPICVLLFNQGLSIDYPPCGPSKHLSTELCGSLGGVSLAFHLPKSLFSLFSHFPRTILPLALHLSQLYHRGSFYQLILSTSARTKLMCFT